MIINRYGRNAQSSDIKAMLGLTEKQKLPREGMKPMAIQGYKVWVRPIDPATSRRHTHRVLVECKRCCDVVSAGRLHQHVCKKKCEVIGCGKLMDTYVSRYHQEGEGDLEVNVEDQRRNVCKGHARAVVMRGRAGWANFFGADNAN
jgi:hypothetical protein